MEILWRKQSWAEDANKSGELSVTLDNFECDENIPTLQDAVEEASYLLNTFNECGHANNYDSSGENGEEARSHAKSEISALKKFINKYKE